MGTNYYFSEAPCPLCGHSRQRHLGKSSAGWRFLLHVYPGTELDTLDGWLKVLDKGTILSEYNEPITKETFLEMLRSRAQLKSHNGPGDDVCDYADYDFS